jgi:hypothetical protein
MTRVALSILAKNPRGFVLFVEGKYAAYMIIPLDKFLVNVTTAYLIRVYLFLKV